jgi:nitrogen regulatory protein PII
MNEKQNRKEKRITCFLPKGTGVKMVEMLQSEKNIVSTNVHSGRGQRTAETWKEQEILTVIVDADRAEEIFEYIYFQGKLNEPGGGFIFQSDLNRATSFKLPDIA